MFDNVRERIAKLEETNESFRKAKHHLQENKNTYLIGAGCLASGYLLRKPHRITVVSEAAPAIAPVFNNTPKVLVRNVINNTVNNGGHMRKIVRCVETDELWASVGKAAQAARIPIQAMSKHLNGHTDHIDGLHYVIEGLAAG